MKCLTWENNHLFKGIKVVRERSQNNKNGSIDRIEKSATFLTAQVSMKTHYIGDSQEKKEKIAEIQKGEPSLIETSSPYELRSVGFSEANKEVQDRDQFKVLLRVIKSKKCSSRFYTSRQIGYDYKDGLPFRIDPKKGSGKPSYGARYCGTYIMGQGDMFYIAEFGDQENCKYLGHAMWIDEKDNNLFHCCSWRQKLGPAPKNENPTEPGYTLFVGLHLAEILKCKKYQFTKLPICK